MVPKGMQPLNTPQRAEDLKPADGNGLALQDWLRAPTQATHLAFGYTAAANGVLVLYGNLDDVRQTNPQSAQLFNRRYTGSLDNAGATKAATNTPTTSSSNWADKVRCWAAGFTSLPAGIRRRTIGKSGRWIGMATTSSS